MNFKRLLATTMLVVGTSLTVPAAHVDFGITVGAPPPPPPAVVVGPVGVAPGPGYVWVDGYWDWVGGRWVWVDGRWMLPPRPHAIWVTPYYHPYHEHFHYHRGHWR